MTQKIYSPSPVPATLDDGILGYLRREFSNIEASIRDLFIALSYSQAPTNPPLEPAYGSMTDDSSQTVALSTTFTNFNAFTAGAGLFKNVTLDEATGMMTVALAGVYEIRFSAMLTVTALASSTGRRWAIRCYNQDTAVASNECRTMVTYNEDSSDIDFCVLMRLEAGHRINMQNQIETGTYAGTAWNNRQFSIVRIDE